MKPGDIVRVKGLGGPHMVVLDLEEEENIGERRVFWYRADGTPITWVFPTRVLEPVLAEEAAPIFDANPQANALASEAYRQKVAREIRAEEAEAADRLRYAHTEGISPE